MFANFLLAKLNIISEKSKKKGGNLSIPTF